MPGPSKSVPSGGHPLKHGFAREIRSSRSRCRGWEGQRIHIEAGHASMQLPKQSVGSRLFLLALSQIAAFFIPESKLFESAASFA